MLLTSLHNTCAVPEFCLKFNRLYNMRIIPIIIWVIEIFQLLKDWLKEPKHWITFWIYNWFYGNFYIYLHLFQIEIRHLFWVLWWQIKYHTLAPNKIFFLNQFLKHAISHSMFYNNIFLKYNCILMDMFLNKFQRRNYLKIQIAWRWGETKSDTRPTWSAGHGRERK